MEIYKAPKYLVLHMKRFKSGNSIFKTKIQRVVHFPIEGLDLSNYVCNRNLTEQYAKGETNEDT